MTEEKKTLKMHLMEIFLRKDFIECKNKKEEMKKTFKSDLKWAMGYSLFLIICFLIVYINSLVYM